MSELKNTCLTCGRWICQGSQCSQCKKINELQTKLATAEKALDDINSTSYGKKLISFVYITDISKQALKEIRGK